MRYNCIRKMDVSNSNGISVSLFLQGCNHHCEGCFNPETWDYSKGKLWDDIIEKQFINLCKKPYIKTISILGGEPFDQIDELSILLSKVKKEVNKPIWLWTGYLYEEYKDNNIMEYIDILIDGQFHQNQKDLTLKYKGSSNQRVIDIKKSLECNGVILYEE